MGSVYVAQQLSVGRRRALKLMHRELLADSKLRDRFVQEAVVRIRAAVGVFVAGARVSSDALATAAPRSPRVAAKWVPDSSAR